MQMQKKKKIKLFKYQEINKKSQIIKDYNYQKIFYKLKNEKPLSYYEDLYSKVYEECRNAAEDKENFTLFGLRRRHTAVGDVKITNAFHSAINKFNKKQKNDFFYYYQFEYCLRCNM